MRVAPARNTGRALCRVALNAACGVVERIGARAGAGARTGACARIGVRTGARARAGAVGRRVGGRRISPSASPAANSNGIASNIAFISTP